MSPPYGPLNCAYSKHDNLAMLETNKADTNESFSVCKYVVLIGVY